MASRLLRLLLPACHARLAGFWVRAALEWPRRLRGHQPQSARNTSRDDANPDLDRIDGPYRVASAIWWLPCLRVGRCFVYRDDAINF